MALGGVAFEMWLGPEGGALRNGISVLTKHQCLVIELPGLQNWRNKCWLLSHLVYDIFII